MWLRRWWMLILPPAIVLALVFVLFRVLVVEVQRVGLRPSSSWQIPCNLTYIADAMSFYADKHGNYPPPAIYSKDGKPLLSWRVLMLPYLREEQLFSQFRLDEPWDSDHNVALLPRMPQYYASYYASGFNYGHDTTFRVLVGPGAAFEGPRGIPVKEFTDGRDRTILIVEAAEAVPWTKPAELPYGAEGALPRLGRRFPDKFCVAFADGAVKWAPRNAAESALRAAITRAGREPWDPLVP